MSNKINILIVEDHPLYRKAIVSIFKMLSYVNEIMEADNGLLCMKHLHHVPFDVVLLDIQMPEMDGINTMKRIRTEFPKLTVIVLTQFADPKFYRTMMGLGAKGYLLKSTTEDELIDAFESVVFGNEIMVSEEVKTEIKQEHEDDTRILAKRELEILALVCQGMSSQEIAESLFISWHTVSNHRKAIKRKIGVDSIPEMVQWAKKNNVI